MSRKPDLAQDINELAERSNQNVLRLLDHAKRDDRQTQVASSSSQTERPPVSQKTADGVGEYGKPSTTARNTPTRKPKKVHAKHPETAEARKTFTTQLPPSTIKRLKRATSHQHLNDLEPDTIQGIVHEAIEEWCKKRSYT